MINLTRSLSVSFGKYAGRFTIGIDMLIEQKSVYYHLFPYQEFQQWGIDEEKYFYGYSFGLGPLLLVCWN